MERADRRKSDGLAGKALRSDEAGRVFGKHGGRPSIRRSFPDVIVTRGSIRHPQQMANDEL
jgi:hypothetical protein